MANRHVHPGRRSGLLAILPFCLLLANPSAAADFHSAEDLVGTTWLASETHDRTTVDRDGIVQLKEGKNIYVQFVELNQGVHSVKINWWNTQHEINVLEYAVMIPAGENTYTYVETSHPKDSGFPGIEGAGTFRMVGESTAELSQIGHLLDGSASAFITRLEKVDAPPVVPIPQTYP